VVAVAFGVPVLVKRMSPPVPADVAAH